VWRLLCDLVVGKKLNLGYGNKGKKELERLRHLGGNIGNGEKGLCHVGPGKHTAYMCLSCASAPLTANNLAGKNCGRREELETPNPSVCLCVFSYVCRVFFISIAVSPLFAVFFWWAYSAETGSIVFRV
jgi:hypothetical protein